MAHGVYAEQCAAHAPAAQRAVRAHADHTGTCTLRAFAGGACSMHIMVTGFRVHFTQGPTVCRHPMAVTAFEVEPKPGGASEKWLLALQARPGFVQPGVLSGVMTTEYNRDGFWNRFAHSFPMPAHLPHASVAQAARP